MRIFVRTISIILILLFVVALDSCKLKDDRGAKTDYESKSYLERVKESGVLRVITDYNSTSYFIYKGRPMGFHYELLQDFASHLGVRVEVQISTDISSMFTSLFNNDCDLIAVDLTVTDARSEFVDFTHPIIATRQVLVQRQLPQQRQNGVVQIVREWKDLGGKEVHVQKGSAFVCRLRQISEEYQIDMKIIEHLDYGDEDLIRMVAEGKINYTVTDEHIALVNRTYYRNIDIGTAICEEQNLAWALNKNADDLLEALNHWLVDFKNTVRFKQLYQKYFENPRTINIVSHDYFTLRSGKISPFDNLIKKHAQSIDWDWRLLAALIFQESQFNVDLKSWAGAYGIMQLMPETADNYGIDTNSTVDEQIRAGVLFIKYLQKIFDFVEDKEEKQKFVLASYNSGPGHVLDAMRLAEKFGKDKHKWTAQTDSFMLKKSNPKYYHMSEVKNGYSRGIETYKFVEETIERYQHFKNAVK